MSGRRPRLILCDPCLDRVGAHPWAYAVALAAAAAAEGMECDVVCHERFRAPAGPVPRVRPLLRRHGHSRLTAFAELERLESSPARRPGAGWGDWLRPRDWLRADGRRRRIARFAADIAPVIDGLSPGDVFLVATASELDVAGLAMAIAARRPPAGIGWHLQFHAPLLSAEPGDGDGGRIRRVRRLLGRALARAAPHRLRFHATTAELAAEWTLAGAEAADVLPWPVAERWAAGAAPAGSAAGGGVRVSLLGDARAEKNSQLVAAFADAIAADAALAARLQLAVQTNPGFPPDSRRPADRAVAEALAAVRSRRDGLVEAVEGPLGDDALLDEIGRADALLLPYDPVRYRRRLSALLLEARAAGRVGIVAGGGWMARQYLSAHRAHAARLLALLPPLAEEHAAPADLAVGQRLPRDLHPPTGADTAVVEVAWRPLAPPAGSTGAADAPLGVALGPGAALLAAAPDGGAVPAVFRIGEGGPRPATVVLEAPGPGAVHVAGLTVRWLRAGRAVPLGAEGIVLARPDRGVDGLREFVEHRDHYAASAAAAAAEVARAHAPRRVLAELLA